MKVTRWHRTGVRVLVMVLLLGLLIPGSGLAQPAAPPADRTIVHYVSPWGVASAEPALETLAGGDARCDLLAFLREYRSDVYRCFFGDTRIDTCFAGGVPAADGRTSLICMRDPFDAAPTLVQADLSGWDPWPGEPGQAPERYPWHVALANGTRCALVIGFMPAVANQRINYQCDDGGMVFGFIDRSLPLWQVNYLGRGAVMSDAVTVTDAWY